MKNKIDEVLNTLLWLENLRTADANPLRTYTDESTNRHLHDIQLLLSPLTFHCVLMLQARVDDISLQQIKVRMEDYGSSDVVVDTLGYLFHDPELLENWENGHLSSETHFHDLENLLRLQADKRKILFQLVTAKKKKHLRKPWRHCSLEMRTQIKRMGRPLIRHIGSVYIGHGIAFHHGLGRVLFGSNGAEMAVSLWAATRAAPTRFQHIFIIYHNSADNLTHDVFRVFKLYTFRPKYRLKV